MLALVLALCIAPGQAQAAQSGTMGQGCSWTLDDQGNMTIYPTNGVSGTMDRVAPAVGLDEENYYNTTVRSITIAAGVKAPNNSWGLFEGLRSVTSIDLSELDTSQVTMMGGMFSDCSSLASLDLSGFDTSQVTNMMSMFFDCYSLASLDLSGFDTSQVTSMDSMFSGSSLASLDLSGFDTSQVMSMNSMFNDCPSLVSLDLSHFDTSQVSDFQDMFADCSSLSAVDVSSFDFSQAHFADEMFYGCTSLSSVDLGDFNASYYYHYADTPYYTEGDEDFYSGVSLIGMFQNCPELKAVDLSSSAVVHPVNIADMFSGCRSLEAVDLSSIDGSILLEHQEMEGEMDWPQHHYARAALGSENVFAGCDSLASVKLGPNFSFKGEAATPRFILPDGIWSLDGGSASRGAYDLAASYDGATMAGTWVRSADSATPMYRLYNPWTGEHFYTSSADECNGLTPLGWQYEGNGWYAPASGDEVYRLYNQYGGEHHYTLSASERDGLIAAGWSYEGVGWFSAPEGTEDRVPLYRQYNPYAFANNHNYTVDKDENDNLIKVGWRAEGIGWYGVSVE